MSALPIIVHSVGKGAAKTVPSVSAGSYLHCATPSNCRNLLLDHWYRQLKEMCVGTAGKPVGMVTIQWIGTIGSQVLRACTPTDAVHRLNGGGSTCLYAGGLKI
jgi:hypothetical protein